MNQELILKTVSAVMGINELGLRYSAGIQVSEYSLWAYVMDGHNICQYVYCNQNAQEEDLEYFINKLNELKGEESE